MCALTSITSDLTSDMSELTSSAYELTASGSHAMRDLSHVNASWFGVTSALNVLTEIKCLLRDVLTRLKT